MKVAKTGGERNGALSCRESLRLGARGRQSGEAVRRTGDELRVHLPMLFRRIRLLIRDEIDGDEGIMRWICIHEFLSTKENTMFTRFLCGVAFAALSVSAASADNLPTVLIR